MRLVRALLVMLLVLGSGWGWVTPALVVSGAPPAAPGAAPAAPAASATIQVTVESDQYDDPSTPGAPGSGCSLREALQLLFNNGDRGCGPTSPAAQNVTIKMPPGDFVLTILDDLPSITDNRNVTIAGPDTAAAGCPSGLITIDGGSQGGRHNGIFHIVNGTLNLKNLTLQHGSRPGGGAVWLGSGALTADKVCFDTNDAASDPTLNGTGGAILDDTGDLTVTNSIFKNNKAFEAGGAVNTNFGYFFKDTFIGNTATAGGAFEVRSPTSTPVFIVQSQFKQNLARPQKPDQMPKAGYTTHGDSFGGGAIQNNGNLQLTQDLIQGNRTELMKGGGGFSNEAGANAQLLETVVTGNQSAARGGGDSNSFIDYAWGGGLYNAGVLQLVRVSVHGNQADNAGAIFNHVPGQLSLFNTTVSNNTAKYLWGGLVNENAEFDAAASQGAEIHLTHATIGANHASSSDPADNDLSALYPLSVIFANSILDAGCNVMQFTLGRSVMTGDCPTEPDVQVDPQAGTDISNTSQFQLGLQPLSAGNSIVPMFMVQRIDGNSIAAGIGSGNDGAFGCGNIYILHLDQNQAPRPAHLCDAGAIQAAAVPAQFSSAPGPGLIQFPLIDLSQGQSGSLVNLVLHNLGGGALTYQVQDEGGSSAITNDTGFSSQGTLFKNQQATLSFACNPTEPGQYWHEITIETDAPNQAQADYQLQCDVVGPMGLPAMMQMPGPYDMPMPPPGQTSHSSFDMSNPGHMPLMTTYSLGEMGPPWMSSVAAAGQAPSSPAVTLNPGQSLHVDVACMPSGPGVFLNTLTFTTTDPANPVIQYQLACEGQVVSPPEALHTAVAYTPSPAAHPYGLAVSPDGLQVLTGGGASEITLSSFVRDPSTGALTQNGWVGLPGMSAIQSVHYSHDGQYVYYTSSEGNGIVALQDTGDSLGASQVITSGTADNTCIIGHLPFFCANNVMHGADGLAVSPDDQFVYVVGYYDNSLTTFQRQPNGQLDLYQIITGTVNGLSGPVKVAVSPDGNDVYVASFNSNTIAVFQRTGAGVLGFQAAYQNGSGGLTHLGAPSDLAVSPDGNYVYVAASTSNAVDVFQRSSADGGLSLSSVITGVTGVWGLAITHDDAGRRLFLTTQTTNQVQVYGRDQTTGALTFVGANTVSDPVFVAVSPDDLDVYASRYNAQSLQHFQTVENAPVLTHVSPASAVVGGSAFTLTVGGGRYYPNSQIVWNGNPLATVFVNQHELRAAVAAGFISAQGSPPVLVRNPAPGGGDSAPLPFVITAPAQPPVPSIESLDPSAASFGGGDQAVLVHGANFAPDAQVFFNHIAVPTLFINVSLLQITLSADIVSTPGDGGLEVTNGGGAPALSAPQAPAAPGASSSSSVVSFKVNPPGVPAAPALSSLSPASVVSGSAAIWLTVLGHNFSANPLALSVGRWNGLARPSVVLDARTLLMNVTQADLAAVQTASVTVLTPGAGASGALSFRVRAANEKPVPVVAGATLKFWTLVVRGSDFVPGAQIFLNGSPRATTFINAYELTTPVTPADHGVVITVSNPGPGGGPSNLVVAFLSRIFLPLVRH